MAAGKTTVARLLAARFERGVHLQGDVFRRSIVAGRAEITPDLPPAALEQLRLRYRLAAQAADARAAAAGRRAAAAPGGRRRPRGRPGRHGLRGLVGRRAVDVFERETPRLGLWLDTSEEPPEQTVDRILATAGETAVW
jgi:hypothetical protein